MAKVKAQSAKDQIGTQPNPKKRARPSAEFDVDQWVDFIEIALYEDPSVLGLGPKEEELYQGFIRILNQLSENPGAQRRFGEAATRVFESVKPLPLYAEVIYTLLQIINHLTPTMAKPLVRRRVFERAFKDLQFAAMNLHSFALAIAGRWDVDPHLANHIREFNEGPLEFRDRILSLRLLARRDPSEAYSFLPKVISELQAEERVKQLYRELRGVTISHTYVGLFRWYRDNQTRLQEVANFPLFRDMLMHKMLPREALSKSTNDPYERLFAYYLHADSLVPAEMDDLYDMRGGSSAEFYGELLSVLDHARIRTKTIVDDPMSPGNMMMTRGTPLDQEVVKNKNGSISVDRITKESFLVALQELANNEMYQPYATN